MFLTIYVAVCRPDQYKCPSDDKCISRDYLCDLEVDCDDGTDEVLVNCSKYNTDHTKVFAI